MNSKKVEELSIVDLISTKDEEIKKRITQVEYVSIFIVLVCLIVSTILAIEENSAASSALAVDSFLDLLSFVAIIWRYSSRECSVNKERNTLLILAFLFIISACLVEIESIRNMLNYIKPNMSKGFIIINFAQGACFAILGAYKFYLASKTSLSHSLKSDAVNSIISAFDCFAMSVSMWIYMIDSDVWYLDSMFGSITGLFILAYGVHISFVACR